MITKQTFFFLLICIFLISCTPNIKLQGRYVSDARDTIIIAKTGTIISSDKNRDDNLIVKQRGNLLKFKTTWYVSRLLTPLHKLYFNISGNTTDSVVLSPITKWSKLMFENRTSIIFRKDSTRMLNTY